MTTVTPGVFSFDCVLRSDVGRVRKVNEDSAISLTESGLWVVSDGMGGHRAGDFASQTIVGNLSSVGVAISLEDLKARFMDRLSTANATILNRAQELGEGTIGATLASLLIHAGTFAAVWSGDSRVYRMQNGVLTRLSRDHTEVQALLDSGRITEEEAENWPRKNVITRAIGVGDVPQCDVNEGALADRDLFLICSDGLTEYFEDGELSGLLAGADSLETLGDHLIATANARGGKDNVSVILLRCHAQSPEFLRPVWAFPEFEGTL